SKYGWWQNFYVDELIEYATKNLRIDPNRIILTGLSMGGGGTWQYPGTSLENAKRLAAIGVSCGACTNANWSYMTQANLPIWAFHAEDDNSAAPVTCTKGAINSINALNPTVKPYFTLWPTGGHWIWDRVYDVGYSNQNPNIYEWFLAQNKSLAPNIRPVANAGSNQSITTGTASVTLNAGASTDRDGKLVRYIWSKISGPSFGTINTPVSENGVTTVTNLTQAGTYIYEVKAVDDRADWTTAQVTITVTDGPAGGNQNPVARAGNDISITAPANSVTLNGSGSSDPDGSISAYEWSKVSGPAEGTIAAPNSVSTAVNSLAVGTYVFRLKVTDNKGATAQDDITVTVNKSGDKPTAWTVDAGADQTITLPTNSVKLDGSKSSDPSAPLQKYEWAKFSGPAQGTITSPSAVATDVTNLAAGTYGFKLTAWNSTGESKSDSVYITVKAATGGGNSSDPKAGLAKAGADITITLPTNSTTLNASASVDPLGEIKEFKWRKISGPAQYTIANQAAAITNVTGLEAGVYGFEVMVWGKDWVPRADTVLVTVKAATGGGSTTDPKKGLANAGADITITLPTNTATLNASASVDPLGEIKEFKWRKISGPTQGTIVNPAAAITNITGLAAGNYNFEVMVWGKDWVPRADTVLVTVKAAAGGGNSSDPKAGLANAGADIIITLPVNSVTLNASASVDPLGQIKEYKWRKVGGPAQGTIVNPAATLTTVTGLAEGVYAFEVMVWGKDWVPRADTMEVVVKSAIGGTNSNDPKAGLANAGPDIAITLPANSASLNGSASVDPLGQIKEYKWRKIIGPAQVTIGNPAAVITPITNMVEGIYSFELMVWGKDWVPRADTVLVIVSSVAKVAAQSVNTETQLLSVNAAPKETGATADKLKVYPNPAVSMINVETTSKESGSAQLRLYNSSGSLIRRINFNQQQSVQIQQVSVSDLTPGVYNVEITINNKTTLVSRFIKQ
ncbi:MAG: T9SS type A sorting domain-containing protein, partial [Chitinophagaceae bacterium]|nr:T9SS type A sorting domain-containing protein [Chitinophagaceae bacterium]